MNGDDSCQNGIPSGNHGIDSFRSLRGVHDQWHKITALVMRKLNVREVSITLEDFQKLEADAKGSMPCIIAHAGANDLKILAFDTEAEGVEYIAKNQGRG